MALEGQDRDTLIRMEQQLKNSNDNQARILSNLNEIYTRLEEESKTVTVINGELKGHFETSKVQWKNLEKSLNDLDDRIKRCEKKQEENSDAIAQEKNERQQFEKEVKTSLRVVSWICGALSSIAAVAGGFAAVLQVMK